MTIREAVAEYVAYKKSIGMVFSTDEVNLVGFCKSLGRHTRLDQIDAEKVRAFILGTGPITTHCVRKHATLRGFCQFALRRGYLSRSPMPERAPKTPEEFKPHIYSREELRRLLDGITTYQHHTVKLQPHTFRSVLVLLYGAALRVSEAINLNVADVNLTDALLTICFTKFNKTRIVPLGPQLAEIMAQYWRTRHQAGHCESADAPFFVLRTGERLNRTGLEDSFLRLRQHVGVYSQGNRRHQPRLHDMRHSFSVHRMTTWYQQGGNVQQLLPALATFLGHCEIASTQRYLTVTPELFCEALQRFERYAQGGNQ